MTAQILSAKPVVESIKQDLIRRCESLKRRGIVPSMSVILVGDNPASLSYIRNKQRMCEEIGASFRLHQLSVDTPAKDFLDLIQSLNDDTATNGIIIQLPVSKKLQGLDLPNLVVPGKDIDGFHGYNTQFLYAGSTDLRHLMPCTPKGIIRLLQHYGIEIAGKHAVVIGRSLIVGKPLSLLLSNFNATVTLAHSRTVELKALTRSADIIVAAIGRAHLLDATYFDPSKKTIVVDVGMNTLDGTLTGDVNQPAVKEVVSAMTPVPGGVGPMTVISLIDNLISATEIQNQGSK
jgi:methylenetetrahydrofolate dehydrogenase (NADP+) / methenyltetrahydrofolate cyclohydrolase